MSSQRHPTRYGALRSATRTLVEIRLLRETAFYCAMPGTTPENGDWVRRKRNTVELLQRSSYSVWLALAHEGLTLEQKMGLPLRDYAFHGGSLPSLRS